MLREVKVVLSLLTRVVTELEIRLNPEVASQADDVSCVGLVEILEPLVKSTVTSTLRLKTCEQEIQFSQLGKQVYCIHYLSSHDNDEAPIVFFLFFVY